MSKKIKLKKKMTAFGIEKKLTKFENSRYHLICIPYAETVSYLKGTEMGPYAIFKASEQVELYDIETESEPYLKGISHKEINVSRKIQDIWEETSLEVAKCLKLKKFPVLLGGEHTISQGGILGCKKYYQNLSILQIDAHSDLKNQYLDDSYSHACALRHAFNDHIPIVQLGIRSLCPKEHQLIKDNPEQLKTFFANKQSLNIEEILNNIKTENVYITIDLDGFDPSVIRDVGTPEPGGLFWYDVINLLQMVFNKFNVVATDIVELCPNKYSTPSDFTAAKLLYKILSFKE